MVRQSHLQQMYVTVGAHLAARSAVTRSTQV
jgi:hypothetical protein